MMLQNQARGSREKPRPLSKREKAWSYAQKIKKPTQAVDFFGKAEAGSASVQSTAESDGESFTQLSHLDQMELEHEQSRIDISAIRRGYGL